MRSAKVSLAIVLAGLTIYLTITFAGTTGQIKGRVATQDTGEPVIGASVLVVGTTQGAVTDGDGKFQILRLDPGTYTLRISSGGIRTVDVADVVVKIDSTTEVNRTMTRKSAEDLNKTITVVGTQDILDRFMVAGSEVIPQQRIKQRPVQTVDNLLEQVAGVRTTADGQVFVRGGRAGEVAYIVDGVPIGDPCRVAPVYAPANGGNAVVNGQAFDAMFFKHSGVNPFVDTEDDHLSTFGVDVDDASFILTRSYLDRGAFRRKTPYA